MSSDRGSCTDAVVCTIGALTPGQRATITIRARVLDAAVESTVTNVATITDTGASDDPSPDNNSAEIDVEVPVSSDLRVDKSFAPTPNPSAGDLVTYTVTVTNDGPSTAANVSPATCSRRSSTWPARCPRRPTPAAGAAPGCRLRASCAAPSTSSNPGQTETITITARLRPDSRGKTVVNSIVRDLGLGRSQSRARDRHGLLRADPRRGPRADQGRAAGPGRAGRRRALHVPVRQPRAEQRPGRDRARHAARRAHASSATRQERARRPGQAVTCALGPLDAGASGELGVDVRVDPSLAGQTVRNAASIAPSRATRISRRRRSCPSSNSDAADLVVAPLPVPTPSQPTPAPPAGGQPRLVVEKSVRGAGARVGDELVWSVRVRNTGNAPASESS